MNYVWIVEMMEGRKWVPTVGCGLGRLDARRELADWKRNNPYDRFRLRKYRAVQS